MLLLLAVSSEYPLAAVIFYNWYVPEEERHDSALKRNKEALIAELNLWEGYLEKVAHACQGYMSNLDAFHHFHCFSF